MRLTSFMCSRRVRMAGSYLGIGPSGSYHTVNVPGGGTITEIFRSLTCLVFAQSQILCCFVLELPHAQELCSSAFSFSHLNRAFLDGSMTVFVRILLRHTFSHLVREEGYRRGTFGRGAASLCERSCCSRVVTIMGSCSLGRDEGRCDNPGHDSWPRDSHVRS